MHRNLQTSGANLEPLGPRRRVPWREKSAPAKEEPSFTTGPEEAPSAAVRNTVTHPINRDHAYRTDLAASDAHPRASPTHGTSGVTLVRTRRSRWDTEAPLSSHPKTDHPSDSRVPHGHPERSRFESYEGVSTSRHETERDRSRSPQRERFRPYPYSDERHNRERRDVWRGPETRVDSRNFRDHALELSGARYQPNGSLRRYPQYEPSQIAHDICYSSRFIRA
ncbi:hypothetical protein P280DRAFT_546229, partial [Massarina eburnea CBS 473.64]